MTFPSRTREAGDLPAPESPQPVCSAVRKRQGIPEYEKPLIKTGERRLWRTLNSGDRVEVIQESHCRSGTIDVLMRDRSTVWILLDHGMGRISVSEGDGIALVPTK